ncbi:tyrosine-type recombinase/integrase [Asaia lannensis]|uniref:tyrosine-type recombinase/integrase n=1 Tax=Asaia lannensis TaxID=415421 RepID=UPI00338D8B29
MHPDNHIGVVRCDRNSADGLHLHGLRKAARRLAEMGCTTDQIATITGHATLAEVERYTRAVDQEKLARSASERIKL